MISFQIQQLSTLLSPPEAPITWKLVGLAEEPAGQVRSWPRAAPRRAASSSRGLMVADRGYGSLVIKEP